MAYFLDLFSPETYAAFKRSQQDISAFRYRHRFAAERVKPGAGIKRPAATTN